MEHTNNDYLYAKKLYGIYCSYLYQPDVDVLSFLDLGRAKDAWIEVAKHVRQGQESSKSRDVRPFYNE